MTRLTILDTPHLLATLETATSRLYIDAENEVYFIEFSPMQHLTRDLQLMIALAAERGLEVMDEDQAEPEVLDSGWVREYLAVRADVWQAYEERLTA